MNVVTERMTTSLMKGVLTSLNGYVYDLDDEGFAIGMRRNGEPKLIILPIGKI